MAWLITSRTILLIYIRKQWDWKKEKKEEECRGGQGTTLTDRTLEVQFAAIGEADTTVYAEEDVLHIDY